MKLKLNDKASIDLEKLIESRLLIQANSGGGKSWAIRRIIEQAFGHVQIIVIDPEGEFGNMRSKFGFVYVGKGGDTPAEPRSAALLARRLLELKASAIIDLYELPPHERKHFVKLFCESLVNAPKELWHDCLVVIDEAHVFAPEKSDSEALGPVIDLATRGRKRGYCVVLASQRISKLHKDAAAECNNKLIGRTSLDIDRKRAGEELGLTDKGKVLALRDLFPGEFMAFGPAIGRDVQTLVIGDVIVKPPKRGVSRSKPPAPSSAVKQILAQLADLPKEAAQEAKTIAELQGELRIAQRQLREKRPAVDEGALKKAYDSGVANVEEAMRKEMNRQGTQAAERYNKILRVFDRLAKIIQPFLEDGAVLYSGKMPKFLPSSEPKDFALPRDLISHRPIEIRPEEKHVSRAKTTGNFSDGISNGRYTEMLPVPEHVEDIGPKLSKGAKSVLTYLHNCYPTWKSKAQLWIAAGYSPGGGFNNIIYELTGADLIEKDGAGNFAAKYQTYAPELLDPTFDSAIEKWHVKLSAGARKIFHILYDDPSRVSTKEELATETGYALGGGFNNLVYELTGKELAVKDEDGYKLNPEILEL